MPNSVGYVKFVMLLLVQLVEA